MVNNNIIEFEIKVNNDRIFLRPQFVEREICFRSVHVTG